MENNEEKPEQEQPKLEQPEQEKSEQDQPEKEKSEQDQPEQEQPVQEQKNNPLHGVKLKDLVTFLVDIYGWQELGDRVKINSFNFNPTINSSLKFLRQTPWAREKVESFYLYTIRKRKSNPNYPEEK
ncbi:MAG: hypothetical protein ACI9WO_001381 [Sphingobacteriales bacterium]|jgi:hypothetical protein